MNQTAAQLDNNMKYVEWCIVLLSFVSVSSGCGTLPSNSTTEAVNPKAKYNEGDKVRYKCGGDYNWLSGRTSIQCVNGKWTELTMQCQKKLCGHVELPNGRMDYSQGNSVGDKARAICDDGFTLKGTQEMTCTRNGWSGVPNCEVTTTTCAKASVTNGVMRSGSALAYRPGASVTFACSAGFRLMGSERITCGEDGRWSTKPRCRPVYCPELNIPNSQHAKKKKAGVEIKITCLKGFQRSSGAARVRCSEEGKWVGEIPTCSPDVPPTLPPAPPTLAPAPAVRECREPEHVANFILREQYRGRASYPDGYRVRYECDVGYAWSGGSSTRTCTAGRWTDLQMLCERKSCGSAGEVLHGRFIYTGNQFGDTATVVCEEGYLLVGRPVRSCTSGGWDGRSAVCHAVHCDDPADAPNTVRGSTAEAPYVHGSVINYHCRAGSLIGPSSIYCTKAGAWSAEPPTCRDVSCGVPRFPNASRTMPHKDRYQLGDMVTFRCRQSGVVHAVTCGPEGEWSLLPC